jgi:phosphomannomutase/phosphoglucomutase
MAAYQQQATIEVNLQRSLKLVVDCGHGVTGLVVPELLRQLGCDLLELRTELDEATTEVSLDPNKPGHLQELSSMVQASQSDLGLAFDADGVRLGVIDSQGRRVLPEQCLVLLARDILSRNPGVDILFDEAKSASLVPVILEQGGLPVKWRPDQGPMWAKMRENQALLGGESDGRYYIAEHWFGFDDAMYAAVRLLELIALDTRSSAEIFDEVS